VCGGLPGCGSAIYFYKEYCLTKFKAQKTAFLMAKQSYFKTSFSNYHIFKFSHIKQFLRIPNWNIPVHAVSL